MSRFHRRGVRSWLAGFLAIVPAAFILVPAAFASPRTDASSLRDATTIVIQGQHVAGGCRYEGTNAVAPGQTAVQQDEIAEDAATCTMTLEQGTPTALSGQPPEGSTVLTQTTTATAAAHASLGTDAVTTHSAGYSRTYTEDPAQIDVTSVRNDIDWYWDGTYLTPSATETCSAQFGFFAASGWGLHENDLQCNFDSPSYPQRWIDSTSYAHFKNGVFCFFTDTNVYYDRNHAVGYGDGSLVGRWNVTKSGTCSGLLTVHNTTARTLN